MSTNSSINSANPIQVARGGTGRNSNITYTPICSGTTTTNPHQSIANTGSAGQILVSNGAGQLPSFQTGPSAGKLIKIATTAIVNSSTLVTFTNLTTYKSYVLIVSSVSPNTNAVSIILEVSSDNGSTWLVISYNSGLLFWPYNNFSQNVTTLSSAMIIAHSVSNTSTTPLNGAINLYDAGSIGSSNFQITGTVNFTNTNVSQVNGRLSGTYNPGTTINAVRIRTSDSAGGGGFSRGTFTLYAYSS